MSSKTKLITFACYGTLLDTAFFDAEMELISQESGLDAATVKALFACNEARMMYAEPFLPLDQLIPAILERCDMQMGMHCLTRYQARVMEAMKALPPFPGAVEALATLRDRGYALALLSNACKSIMQSNAAALGNPFSYIVLAEEIGAYKPLPTFFTKAGQILNVAHAQHCHVAQGYFHDIIPAARAGWKRLWVNRGGELGHAAQQPYTEVRALEQILPLFPQERPA